MNKTLDLSSFESVEKIADSENIYAWSVMLDGTLRLNSRLTAKISPNSRSIAIYISSEGRQLIIRYTDAEDIYARVVNKSGNIRAKELMDQLGKRGVKLPARYCVTWNEEHGVWLGELDKHYKFAQTNANGAKAKRERTRGLIDMLPEKGV